MYWFIGLVMGMVVMAALFPTIQRLWSPDTANEPALACEEDSLIPDIANIPAEERPQFDFYKILPELEVVVPNNNIEAKTQPATATNQTATNQTGTTDQNQSRDSTDQYVLQVGSFKEFVEADRFKASLALIGVEPKIDQVTVNGTTWHRVQLGPFTSQREIDRVQRRLENNRIQAIALKLK